MLASREKTIFLLLALDAVQSLSLIGYKLLPFIKKVDVIDNVKYMNSSIQIFSAENRVNVAFNMREVIPNPRLNIVLWFDVRNGTLKAPFYNQTIDLCALIRNPGSHRIAQIAFREMKRHGNMPTKCPIPRGVYQFRGISLSQMRLPAFFIEAEGIVVVNCLVGNTRELTFGSRWYGCFKRIKCTVKERC